MIANSQKQGVLEGLQYGPGNRGVTRAMFNQIHIPLINKNKKKDNDLGKNEAPVYLVPNRQDANAIFRVRANPKLNKANVFNPTIVQIVAFGNCQNDAPVLIYWMPEYISKIV